MRLCYAIKILFLCILNFLAAITLCIARMRLICAKDERRLEPVQHRFRFAASDSARLVKSEKVLAVAHIGWPESVDLIAAIGSLNKASSALRFCRAAHTDPFRAPATASARLRRTDR